MKRKLLILPPIVFGAVILAYVLANKSAPKSETLSERARHVRVIVVQPSAAVPVISGFGAVAPSNKWTATSQVSGEIVYVHPDLKKGAILNAGQEILRIAPNDFRLAIDRAEANIRASEAKIEELLVSEKNTKEILEIEKRALAIAENNLRRQKTLLARGTVSETVVDEKTRDALSQRKVVQELRGTLLLLPAQRAQQLAQKAVYEGDLNLARLDLARTSIRLPFDARIVAVDAEISQYAQPGQSLATADSVAVAEVEAQMPISRFRNMVRAIHAGRADAPVALSNTTFAKLVERMGFEVTIRLSTGDEVIEWPARFARISDTIDPKTRTVGVIAVVDGPYSDLVPGKKPPLTKGLFVEMEVRGKPLQAQLIVPRAALHEGRLYVVNADSRLEIRKVEAGLYQGDIVTVRSGLKAGDKVVVSDLSPAVEGMLLKTTPDPALAAEIQRQARAEGAAR